MTISRRLAWKEWVEDRVTHRAPIDEHFAAAVDWIGAMPSATVLELGPGPEADLQRAVIALGCDYYGADTHPANESIIDLSVYWQPPLPELPFNEATFHAVLARETIEHVDDIYQMIAEIHRVLRPGGRLWFSTPFVFPLHDYEQGDYWRLSDKAWRWLLSHTGFRSFEVSAPAGRLLWHSWQYPTTVLGWAER